MKIHEREASETNDHVHPMPARLPRVLPVVSPSYRSTSRDVRFVSHLSYTWYSCVEQPRELRGPKSQRSLVPKTGHARLARCDRSRTPSSRRAARGSRAASAEDPTRRTGPHTPHTLERPPLRRLRVCAGWAAGRGAQALRRPQARPPRFLFIGHPDFSIHLCVRARTHPRHSLSQQQQKSPRFFPFSQDFFRCSCQHESHCHVRPRRRPTTRLAI